MKIFSVFFLFLSLPVFSQGFSLPRFCVGATTGLDAGTFVSGTLGAHFQVVGALPIRDFALVGSVGISASGADLGQSNIFRPSIRLEGGILFDRSFLLSLKLENGIDIGSVKEGWAWILLKTYDISFSLGFSGIIPVGGSFLSVGSYLGYEFSNVLGLVAGVKGWPFFEQIGHFHWEILDISWYL